MSSLFKFCTVLVVIVMNSWDHDDDLQVSKYFSNNMVVQRDQPIKIWGSAKSESTIEVYLNGITRIAKSKDGMWITEFPKMAASGPYRMTIRSGSQMITVSNILIGDVWLCAGQSNMEWRLEDVKDSKTEIKNSFNENIRQFRVDRRATDETQQRLINGEWNICDTTTSGTFSAVGYYFAKELQRNIKVPIGIINASWGGSRIESWINPKLKNHNLRSPEQQAAIAKAQQRFNAMMQNWAGWFPRVDKHVASSGDFAWADPKLETDDWLDIKVPDFWEQQGFKGLDGVGWYRKTFKLTKEEALDSIQIVLGQIDDCDKVFINGVQVGQNCGWNSIRVYNVANNILNEGINQLVVRVEDFGGGGGMIGEKGMLYIKTRSSKLSLEGSWKFKIESHINMSFGGIYNGMINPLTHVKVKGILWYQGESNTESLEEAIEYKFLFTELIEQWRICWQQERLPFIFVQLPNFTARVPDAWSELRLSQSHALTLPETGQVATLDIGDSTNIHPQNKQTVGNRLASVARQLIYEENICSSGLTYDSHVIKSNKVFVSFNNLDSGLVVYGKKKAVLEFYLADDNGQWRPSMARQSGNQIVVWNDLIKNPRGVSYAYKDAPSINLFNTAGLPANPFQIVFQNNK